MNRTLIAIGAALLSSLLLVGVTFSRSREPPAEFRFVNGIEPKTLDPQLMTGQPEGRIADGIFEGLTRRDARTHRPAPGVAERWEVSPDGRRYTFHLRSDALWTDGRPVSASDFVHAWRRLLDPKVGAEYAYLLFPLRHAEALHRGSGAALEEARRHFGTDAGVFAPDDRTLVVELRAPVPYFLELTSFYPTFPTPRWLTDDPRRQDDWFLPEHIVSNGPYRLETWLVNDHIRLVRNERYWGLREVKSRTIDALSVENGTTALNLYLTSAVDWLPGAYPSDLVDDLKTRPDFYQNPGMVVYFYRFNTTRPPFQDRRVREALNLAVDRVAIARRVLGLGQLPAATFVPPGMPGYRAPESGIRHDVARARQLLAEAGYPDGQGFPSIGILYNTSESHKKMAEVIADQLRSALRIEVNAYNQEWQSFLDTVRKGDYGMARAGWVGDYADPNTFLDLWVTGGGNNQTGFSSPSYDALLAAASDVQTFLASGARLPPALEEPEAVRASIDRARAAPSDEARLEAQGALRMQLFREAEAILVRHEFPILPLYFYVVSGLVRPEVRGFYSTLRFDDGSTGPNLQDTHPLRDLWVERPGSAR